MPDEFPHDVFLSHSAQDKAVVRPLAERLRVDGVKHSDFGFRHSDSGFSPPCLSAHAFGSDWAQLESGTFRFRNSLNKERWQSVVGELESVVPANLQCAARVCQSILQNGLRRTQLA